MMIDLCKKVLPSTVDVEGNAYEVKTDFRDWLNFLLKRKNNAIKEPKDFDFLFKDKKPNDFFAAFNELCDFCDRRNELPRKIPTSDNRIIFDFEKDSDLIYSAFWDCYGIDLMTVDLHWYQFNVLLDGLHDTKLNQIMGIRAYDKNDHATAEQNAEKLRQAWEIEIPLTEEEKEALDRFDSLLY